MRTAPPTEPGIPTKNSSPPMPAAAAPAGRAPGARPRRPRATRRRARASTSSCSNVAVEHDREPGEAGIGDEEVRAAADDEHRHVVLAERVGDPPEVVVVVDAHEHARTGRRTGTW